MNDKTSLILKKVFLAAASLLALACAVLVFNLSLLTIQVRASVKLITEDVRRVTESFAEISEDIVKIQKDVKAVKDKVSNMVPITEMKNALGTIIEVRNALRDDSGGPSPEVDAEIRLLMDTLLKSECTVEKESGKKQKLSFLHKKTMTKYKAFYKSIKTSEDFIKKVASKTVLKRIYYVIDKDGNKSTLEDWLNVALLELRKNPPLPPAPAKTDIETIPVANDKINAADSTVDAAGD
ncbi:DUF5329 family protein [bacterium AH-315-E10]|nr:DUF5329 family protein [bacterium AH-315-E10]